MPSNLTAGLLTGSGAQTFNGYQIGRLLGVDESVMAGADLIGLVQSSRPGDR
jgi:hypothetical protein